MEESSNYQRTVHVRFAENSAKPLQVQGASKVKPFESLFEPSDSQDVGKRVLLEGGQGERGGEGENGSLMPLGDR